MGAVAIAYNLNTMGTNQLKLNGTVLANIYLKNITYWDDPAIEALNPGISFPHTAIAVVHQFRFIRHQLHFHQLPVTGKSAMVNPSQGEPQALIGRVMSAVGEQAIVAADVQQIGGSIGYVELAYAVQNNITVALMQNSGAITSRLR